MLSEAFQRDVPGQMFVYPAVDGVALPPEFDDFAAIPDPEQIAELSPAEIAAGQQHWLEEWTRVVEQGRDPSEVR